MATDAAIGERRKAAIKRIEAAVAGDTDYRLEVPRKSQYGQAMMILQTIEAIADYVENAPKAPMPEPEIVMVIPAKYLLAEELARNGATKAEIVNVLLSEDEKEGNDASA